jgi:LemA protein
MIGWIVLGIIVLLLLWAVGIYNRLVRLRALVKEAFSGITVQLRRRAEATSAGSVQATAQADAAMTSLLGRLMAVAENYPELKANQNFLQLQDQLASIETELQSARRYYNATVRDLNSTIQSFPPVLIARPAGFSQEAFYEDEDKSIQTAPTVAFPRSAA